MDKTDRSEKNSRTPLNLRSSQPELSPKLCKKQPFAQNFAIKSYLKEQVLKKSLESPKLLNKSCKNMPFANKKLNLNLTNRVLQPGASFLFEFSLK